MLIIPTFNSIISTEKSILSRKKAEKWRKKSEKWKKNSNVALITLPYLIEVLQHFLYFCIQSRLNTVDLSGEFTVQGTRNHHFNGLITVIHIIFIFLMSFLEGSVVVCTFIALFLFVGPLVKTGFTETKQGCSKVSNNVEHLHQVRSTV